MTTITSTSFSAKRFATAFALCVAAVVPGQAADWSFKVFDPPVAYQGQFDLRFWFGQGNTSKNLFDTTGAALVSRLTYSNFSIFAGEGVGRFDFNNGWFVKGYVGGGGLWSGKLKDEDFPPAIVPYSATLSTQKFGSLTYGSVDAGVNFARGPDFHVGLYAGYHFLRETVSAFGCGQIASNPNVCGGGIPDFVKVITQVNNWNSVRVGIDAAFEVNRLKLSVDAAYLPVCALSGTDAHWLRIEPINTTHWCLQRPGPEDGTGWGDQLDGLLSYRLSDCTGRRNRRPLLAHGAQRALAHFEGHGERLVTLSTQPVNWKTDNFGVFLQTSVKLGPYPLIAN